MSGNGESNYIFCRKFSLTVVSAKNLPNVRMSGSKTRAYAKISIKSDETKHKFETPVDKNGGLNPLWDHTIHDQVSDEDVKNGLRLVIKIYCIFGAFDRSRYIGEVHASMDYLYGEARRMGGAMFDWPITQGSAETSATLCFSCTFGGVYSVNRKTMIKKKLGKGAKILRASVKCARVLVTVSHFFHPGGHVMLLGDMVTAALGL